MKNKGIDEINIEGNEFFLERSNQTAPLAERMRPTTLDDFIGQEHLVGKGKLLRRLIESNNIGSSIFYGPPGVGKTTLSGIIASKNKGKFKYLNAVSSGVGDAKAVIEEAKKDKELYGVTTYLLLDECHRWTKAQSDSILGAVEKGDIIFIGSTTENPFYSMTRAIVSRCRVFEFKSLSLEDIVKALKRAIVDKEHGYGKYKIEADDETLKAFASFSGGDVRFCLNSLEVAFKTTLANENGVVKLTPEIAKECSGGKNLGLDQTTFYDMLSAFCKSLRGTDPDGALYWAYRMIESGVDPEVVLRRLIAHSSEDVGLANNNALIVSVSALTAYQNLGYPEGLIPMTQAIINTAMSPKSNSVVVARDTVLEAVKSSFLDNVPPHLKNYNFLNEKREEYKYPHEYGGFVNQQYLPDSVKDRVFYKPTENGNEQKLYNLLKEKNGSKK